MAEAAIAFSPGLAMAADPTCSDVLPIQNHAQHIIGDYVLTGVGHEGLIWPVGPAVGQNVGGNRGASAPGAAAAHGHFTVPGLPPGASFCNPQAHPNGFDTPDIGPPD